MTILLKRVLHRSYVKAIVLCSLMRTFDEKIKQYSLELNLLYVLFHKNKISYYFISNFMFMILLICRTVVFRTCCFKVDRSFIMINQNLVNIYYV